MSESGLTWTKVGEPYALTARTSGLLLA